MTILQFKKPDPRNGELYTTESHCCRYADGKEIEMFDGFAVVHMSRSGDSASIDHGYATLAEAEAAALQEALRRNAAFIPSRAAR